MTPPDELSRLRKEARLLRKEDAAIRRSRDAAQEKNVVLGKKVAAQREKIKTLTKEKEDLQKEITELKSRLNLAIDKAKTYAGMIFKSSVRKEIHASRPGRGGTVGHRGNARRLPERIDREGNVCLTNCYHCGTALNPTMSVDERIVEDIPQTTTVVTRYIIQRQWCSSCQQEVRAIPGRHHPRLSVRHQYAHPRSLP